MREAFRKSIDFEDIAELYWYRGMTLEETAQELNVDRHTLEKRMRENEFPMRTKIEAMRVMAQKNRLNLSKRGPQNINWKGGLIRDGLGYIRVWTPNGYVRRSHLVWELVHGRKLPKGWVIHHVNGDKVCDLPNNLIAYPFEKHQKLIPELLSTIKSLELENKKLKKEAGYDRISNVIIRSVPQNS
jgi:hypothetical protein